MTSGRMSQADFDSLRYIGEKNGERFDWLYFPKTRLYDLSLDTILLAAPGTRLDSAGVERRLVWSNGREADRIPEADFQRLIREQNPPPAP